MCRFINLQSDCNFLISVHVDFSRENCYSPEVISTTKFKDPVANDVLDGKLD